jgi:class 3 adenylate cyclase
MDLVPDIRKGSSPPGAVVRTFLIADIRGYSTFTRERGDEAAARLATVFADLARDAVEARSGTVIELRGDEALGSLRVDTSGGPRWARVPADVPRGE